MIAFKVDRGKRKLEDLTVDKNKRKGEKGNVADA
jgi:hypothetical protein